jgi:hypothetical protein
MLCGQNDSATKTLSTKTMTMSSNSSGGIGFTGALTILFIGLKLCNVIHWSWWWVLSPIWISVSITIFIIAILAILVIIKELTK